MPNLAFRQGEVRNLIAFLKYTSEMDTEGWPPEPRVAGLTFPQAKPMPVASTVAGTVAGTTSPTEEAANSTEASEVSGAQLVEDNGCTACHAADTSTRVGPGWGGLYGSKVKLADGSETTATNDYLSEAITSPDAQIAEGFPAGVMPSYANILDAGQVEAIVAYIRSLEGEQ
jgi:mono/diheme cytochrome c family protein